MNLFTRIGSSLWSWEPFRRLERSHDDRIGHGAKLLWIALYTTPEAKGCPPGLFSGSITSIAESAGIYVDAARAYLDRLIEDDLVEYDVEKRVLRMIALPDAGESPTNGNAIRGWWRRFNALPECAVRDAHVTTLRWIMEEWSRRNGKPIGKDHAVAWSETFGKVASPTPRARVRKHVQTSLFTPSGASEKSYPQGSLPDPAPSAGDPVDNSGFRPKLNKINTNHITNSFNDRSTTVEPDQDQDPDQDLGSPDPDPEGRQVLVLKVYDGIGFDTDDLIDALHEATLEKFPRALTGEQRLALGEAITAASERSRTPGALVALREYIASGTPGLELPALTLEQRAAKQHGISPDLVAAPGWLGHALQLAIAWKQKRDAQLAMFADARKDLGFDPK